MAGPQGEKAFPLNIRYKVPQARDFEWPAAPACLFYPPHFSFTLYYVPVIIGTSDGNDCIFAQI